MASAPLRPAVAPAVSASRCVPRPEIPSRRTVRASKLAACSRRPGRGHGRRRSRGHSCLLRAPPGRLQAPGRSYPSGCGNRKGWPENVIFPSPCALLRGIAARNRRQLSSTRVRRGHYWRLRTASPIYQHIVTQIRSYFRSSSHPATASASSSLSHRVREDEGEPGGVRACARALARRPERLAAPDGLRRAQVRPRPGRAGRMPMVDQAVPPGLPGAVREAVGRRLPFVSRRGRLEAKDRLQLCAGVTPAGEDVSCKGVSQTRPQGRPGGRARRRMKAPIRS